LMQGGGVKLEGERVSDVNLTFESPADLCGKVLQVGKNKFVRLVS
jgi:tyrosyl-tRNA synthetase